MAKDGFWKIRSVEYNELEWVKDINYLNILASEMDFKKDDFVLDVGTGTGVVAHHISKTVKEIIGLDISSDMLEYCLMKKNLYFFQWDIREPIFKDRVFDKIVARMVFHHIMVDTQKAVNECYRILKDGCVFGIAEGVPPSLRVKDQYIEIFKHKEERLTFYESDLVELMQKAGFHSLKVSVHKQHGMSIKDWLRKSGLSKKKQKIIFDLHVNAPDYFKEDYNMEIKNNDCFVTFKSVIVCGEK